MKTLKELQDLDIMPDAKYIAWYEDAIEWISDNITDWNFTSKEDIQKYLQDLLNK